MLKALAYGEIEFCEDKSWRSCSEDGTYTMVSFIPSQAPGWSQETKRFQDSILTQEHSHKRQENYSRERFDIEQCNVITLVQSRNEIIGLSSLYQRDFYGHDKARCLNRYYVREAHRNPGSRIMRFPVEMIRHQIRGALHFSMDHIFVSVELFKDLWMAAFCDLLSKTTQKTWVYPRNAFLVCPNPTDIRCWQHIAYLTLNSHADDFKIDQTKSFDNVRAVFRDSP